MSSANSLFNSFFVFIFMLVFAFVLDVTVGHAIDVVVVKFADAHMYAEATPKWDNSGFIQGFISNFHLLIYLIPAIGLGQFIYTAIRRQRYDVYAPEEPYYV